MSSIRNNNVSIKLSDNEKKRAEMFAKQRDLTLAEYLRMSALRHRIKPTIVEFNETDHSDKIAELENNITVLEELLEKQRVEFNRSLKPLAKYVKHNGYLQWSEYSSDDDAIKVLRRIRQLNDVE